MKKSKEEKEVARQKRAFIILTKTMNKLSTKELEMIRDISTEILAKRNK